MNRWWLKIGRYAAFEVKPLLLIGGLTLLGTAVGLLTPWPLKLIVDNVLANDPLPESLSWLRSLPGAGAPKLMLAWLAAATVALFLLSRCIAILKRYIEIGAGSRMVYALATDLFSHLQRRALLLHQRNKTGDLIKRTTSDTDCVRDLVMRVFVPAIQSVFTLIGMLAIMWQMNRGLALFALLLSFPLLLIICLLAEPLSKHRYREQELQSQIYSLAEQTLSAMPLIQSFGREMHHNEDFRQLARRTVGANLRYELTGHQFKVSTAAVTAIGTACVLVYGGLAVRDAQLSVGGLLVLVTYFAALYSPLETIAYLSEGFASAKAGARRVLDVLDEEDRPVCDAADAEPLTHTNSAGASVRYENIAFGYEPNRAALNGVSFEIASGETVAIVGESGAGKSTLIALLLRLFDPWEGAIYINGSDIRGVTLASLRSSIAYMPQNPFLLPFSIAENIAYGRPDASRGEIVEAACAAKCDDFIQKLPEGYDTIIGERGATLSVGQRQRLSLARALLKQSPILVLDEPTSALDPATEASILDEIGKLFAGKTTFIVAHRFSTIQRASTAIVLERGRVVEIGPPPELLSAGGRFHELHQLQFGPRALAGTEKSCVSP